MVAVICMLALVLVLTVFDDVKLRLRLREYEHIWSQIEEIGDKNQDGSYTIHFSHVEDHVGSDTHTCKTDAVCHTTSKQAA